MCRTCARLAFRSPAERASLLPTLRNSVPKENYGKRYDDGSLYNKQPRMELGGELYYGFESPVNHCFRPFFASADSIIRRRAPLSSLAPQRSRAVSAGLRIAILRTATAPPAGSPRRRWPSREGTTPRLSPATFPTRARNQIQRVLASRTARRVPGKAQAAFR